MSIGIQERKGIPSQSEYRLILTLINSGGALIKEGHKTLSTANELILLSCNGALQLIIEGTAQRMDIDMRADDNRWLFSGNPSFSSPVTPLDFEILSRWREGRSVRMGWTFRGYALVGNYSMPLYFTFEQNAEKGPTLDTERFGSLAKQIGLSEKFILEVSLEFPSIVDNANFNELAPVRQYVKSSFQVIKRSLDAYRRASTACDFESVVREVRDRSTELLRNHMDQDIDLLVKKLFVNTGSITGPGAMETARLVVKSLRQMADATFNLASKVSHPMTKGTAGVDFYMTAERAEAEFVLFSSLELIQYLI